MKARPRPSRRLDRARWIDAALDAIETGGPGAVAVAPLARQLGVTKGSFYWHFTDRRELLSAALEVWLTRHTTEPEQRFAAISDPGARLRSMFSYALLEVRPTVIVQLLAHLDDPDIAAVVRRATDRRIELIATAYRELGLPRAAARNQALLAYGSFLGFAQLRRDPPAGLATDAQTRRFLQHAQRALIDPVH